MRQVVNKSFVFYATNLEMVDTLKESNPEMANELLYAMVEYGIYGEFESNNPIIKAMMAPVVNGIDKAKGRYNTKKQNVAQAKHYEEIAELHLMGKTQAEIAKILSNKHGENISQQTVSNRLGAIKRDFPELLAPKEEEKVEVEEEENQEEFHF